MQYCTYLSDLVELIDIQEIAPCPWRCYFTHRASGSFQTPLTPSILKINWSLWTSEEGLLTIYGL